MPKAVVIIPTYKEALTIEKTIQALDNVLAKMDGEWEVEVLVVDDSSPDGTSELVQGLTTKHVQVHLLINPTKAGLGAAYMKGMKAAFNQLKADLIFEFDADLSHNPKYIPAFLKKIHEGYDMVLGSRYIPGGSIPANWGLYRKFLSVIGNFVIRFILLDFRIIDWTTGYRAITRKVYEAVREDMSHERFTGYAFQIGFLHAALRQGFKIAEVPIHFVDRTAGKSKLGTEYIRNTLLYILKVRFKDFFRIRR